jgi:excisionase family DNA binding protein
MGTMLTVRSAARLAGVSVCLMYVWIRSGMIAHYRVGRPGSRGGIRIAEADLDAFLAGMRKNGVSAKMKPVAARLPPQSIKLKHLSLPG